MPVAQLVRETATVMQEFTQSGCVCDARTSHSPGRLAAHKLDRQGQAGANSDCLCFLLRSGVRPFGVSLLVAGFDDAGPQLYQVDPSGAYFAWKASAIGKNMTNAKTFLEKRYSDDMELEDAVHTALLTLKEGFEGQISGENVEVAVVGKDRTCRVLTPAEVNDYLSETA
jgi:20S proteasome subunit alpha 2